MNEKEKRRSEHQALNIQQSLDLAVQHHAAGRLPEAGRIYQQISQADPNHPVALHMLGVIAHQVGKNDIAVDLINKALAIKPDDAEAHSNLGLALQDLGKLEEAVASYDKALAIKPDFAEAHSNLGNAFHDLERLDEAVASYQKAIAIKADFAEAHCNLGLTLHDLERLDEAVDSFHKALAIKPDYANAHYNLGLVLQNLGKLNEALANFHKAIAIKPDYTEAHSNLGVALQDLGKLDEAVDSFHKALAIKPDYAEAHYNLGNVLKDLGRVEEAVSSYRRALEINPDYIKAHHNLGLVLLLKGDLKEGWMNYHWRFRADEGGAKQRPFTQALWSGEPLQGKTILVWGEQGVGDEVLFAGMVPDLIDAGAKVIFETDGRLVPLYRRSFTGVQYVARETPPAPETASQDIDFQVPSGGLGRWFRPDFDAFPDRPSYLVADTDQRNALRQQYLEDGGGFLVGIAWVSKNSWTGLYKSMPLKALQPLTKVPGARLIDLQYGDTEGERQAFEKETGVHIIHDEGVDQMKDLDAFAAQVAAMDLIVSVSNTTVHIAGSLGVPTWVLLNTVPLCFWMLERENSPWYPSMRLFRQEKRNDWESVVKSAAAELAGLVKAGPDAG